jgi:hypothetical protein
MNYVEGTLTVEGSKWVKKKKRSKVKENLAIGREDQGR